MHGVSSESSHIRSFKRTKIGGVVFSRLKRVGPLAAISALTVVALGLTGCTNDTASRGDADVNTVTADLASSIDQAIDNALTLSGSTEAVVGIWQGDSAAYVRGYGEGVTGSTKIRAAQASQPIMCALLLSYAAKNDFSLNRKISKDIPRQSGVSDVTYAQLCDQTSAIDDYKHGLGDIFTNNPMRMWPEQELIANGLAVTRLSWPGQDAHLSDTNAVLLDRALRIGTRIDTSDLLSEHVFTPAGMTETTYPSDFAAADIPKGSLQPLTYPSAGGAAVCEAGVTKVDTLSTSMMRGAGATLTDVTDLKNFYTTYLSGGFGGEKLSGMTLETLPAKNPARDEGGVPTEELDTEGPQIGFGGIEKIGSLYGRSGRITGTLTAAYSDPESGLTVVVALNNSSAGAAFVQALAFQLAALTGQEFTWTAEDQGARLAELAICQAPPEEPAEAPAE